MVGHKCTVLLTKYSQNYYNKTKLLLFFAKGCGTHGLSPCSSLGAGLMVQSLVQTGADFVIVEFKSDTSSFVFFSFWPLIVLVSV